jgi:hypothetical protein
LGTSFCAAMAELSLANKVFFAAALAVAFGFEFVNGFHDTANAVTTVIYTPRSGWSRPWCIRAC